jgi:primosomal protein N'
MALEKYHCEHCKILFDFPQFVAILSCHLCGRRTECDTFTVDDAKEMGYNIIDDFKELLTGS